MNFLVINGSPRTLGNTDKLLNEFLSAIQKENKVKQFNVYELAPVACNACGYCKASDGCSKKDLENFFGYYAEADAIIIATPVYNFTVPAPLKALFDRFQRFYEAKHRRGAQNVFPKPKKAVLIVTSGGDGRVGYEIIKRQAENVLKNADTKISASMLACETDTRPLSSNDLEKARSLVRYI